MSVANLTFFFAEAFTSLKRAGITAVITVSTIAIALIMMGSFLLVSMNLDSFLQQMQSQASITAYLHSDASDEDISTLCLKLANFKEIEDIVVITPQQAAQELFSDSTDQQLLQIGITEENNPLPTTLRIIPAPSTEITPVLQALDADIFVENYSYGEDLFEQFNSLSKFLWSASSFVILLLAIVSLFVVYNTVRMTLFTRREEIIIMKLVGATNWFVRGPFIVEGFIQGVIASILATLILYSGYGFALRHFSALVTFFDTTVTSQEVIKLSTKLFLMGIILGVSGSLISLRNIARFSRATPEGF